MILSGNIPLLRGAGLVAQEPLIQARRNLIYASREFQQFRRFFYFEITADYLDLVLRMQEIANAERQVAVSQKVEERETAMVEAGRTDPFQADLARQNTLFAIDRMAQLRENFRFQLDRFKVRIGMETTRSIGIDPTALELPIPKVTLDDAVRTALDYRLDLQNEADRVDDARREVNVAKNNLLGDLNLEMQAAMPTDQDLVRSGLQFRPDETNYTAGVVFSAPLDRMIEEAQYRETQIDRGRRGPSGGPGDREEPVLAAHLAAKRRHRPQAAGRDRRQARPGHRPRPDRGRERDAAGGGPACPSRAGPAAGDPRLPPHDRATPGAARREPRPDSRDGHLGDRGFRRDDREGPLTGGRTAAGSGNKKESGPHPSGTRPARKACAGRISGLRFRARTMPQIPGRASKFSQSRSRNPRRLVWVRRSPLERTRHAAKVGNGVPW
jgi:hypothetical protein